MSVQVIAALLSVMSFGDPGNSKSLPESSLAKMPVKEVTVFKDGHAFVLHEAEMPTNERGEVVLDSLPTPVLGTFWPYSNHSSIKLRSVVAGTSRVNVEKAGLSLVEMLSGNIGADGFVTEISGTKYAATIAALPSRENVDSERNLPTRSPLIMLKTAEGFKFVPVERIQDFTFKNSPSLNFREDEFRNLLTLKFNSNGAPMPKTIPVGLTYLQRGLRWIPSYKISLDGKGEARVQLEATLVNEMVDLDQVNLNLVIGVPSFFFKETTDPMALSNTVAQLSQYFQVGSQSPNAFSNAIQTQSLRMAEYRVAQPAEPRPEGLGPDIPAGDKQEDLYMFGVRNVSLRKGERAVFPVAEFSINYRDVFALDLKVVPPSEFRNNNRTPQDEDMMRLLSNPKVMHKICLKNSSPFPLTTAPALILRDGRILAQGLMHYAATGGTTEIDVTAAVDIPAVKNDAETLRTQNAITVNRENYEKVDLTGTIKLTNFRDKAVELEVTRYVLGATDSASADAKIEKVNFLEDDRFLAANPNPNNYYWNFSYWPYWWSRVNGVSKILWKVQLEPGKSIELNYTWHYFFKY